MYAIAFDLEVAKIKLHYGEPYNPAYDEIKKEMAAAGFEWTQGSVYLAKDNANLTTVYRAIDRLRKIPWFQESVRDIRAFKVEDWSDFTAIVKEKM